MLKGLRNTLAIILTGALLASCVAVPPPADGRAYTYREHARNQQIRANNDAVVGAAVIGLAAGALIGGAIASNNNRNYNRRYYRNYNGGGYYGNRTYYRRSGNCVIYDTPNPYSGRC